MTSDSSKFEQALRRHRAEEKYDSLCPVCLKKRRNIEKFENS